MRPLSQTGTPRLLADEHTLGGGAPVVGWSDMHLPPNNSLASPCSDADRRSRDASQQGKPPGYTSAYWSMQEIVMLRKEANEADARHFDDDYIGTGS